MRAKSQGEGLQLLCRTSSSHRSFRPARHLPNGLRRDSSTFLRHVIPLVPNSHSVQTPALMTSDSAARLIAMYGLDFGSIQQVNGPRGTTYVREAASTEQFWKPWRQSKDTVKAAGFSLRKHHDEWSVGYWSDDEDCPLPPAS